MHEKRGTIWRWFAVHDSITAEGQPGVLAFATRVPGHILPVQVQPGQNYFIHRHGFLCSTPGVELRWLSTIAWRRHFWSGTQILIGGSPRCVTRVDRLGETRLVEFAQNAKRELTSTAVTLREEFVVLAQVQRVAGLVSVLYEAVARLKLDRGI